MMARFVPVVVTGLTALGLLIGGISPGWWITALVAVGIWFSILAGTSVGFRGFTFAPYLPALFTGLAAVGLLAAGASPAWWITALVAVGLALSVFMSFRVAS